MENRVGKKYKSTKMSQRNGPSTENPSLDGTTGKKTFTENRAEFDEDGRDDTGLLTAGGETQDKKVRKSPRSGKHDNLNKANKIDKTKKLGAEKQENEKPKKLKKFPDLNESETEDATPSSSSSSEDNAGKGRVNRGAKTKAKEVTQKSEDANEDGNEDTGEHLDILSQDQGPNNVWTLPETVGWAMCQIDNSMVNVSPCSPVIDFAKEETFWANEFDKKHIVTDEGKPIFKKDGKWNGKAVKMGDHHKKCFVEMLTRRVENNKLKSKIVELKEKLKNKGLAKNLDTETESSDNSGDDSNKKTAQSSSYEGDSDTENTSVDDQNSTKSVEKNNNKRENVDLLKLPTLERVGMSSRRTKTDSRRTASESRATYRRNRDEYDSDDSELEYKMGRARHLMREMCKSLRDLREQREKYKRTSDRKKEQIEQILEKGMEYQNMLSEEVRIREEIISLLITLENSGDEALVDSLLGIIEEKNNQIRPEEGSTQDEDSKESNASDHDCNEQNKTSLLEILFQEKEVEKARRKAETEEEISRRLKEMKNNMNKKHGRQIKQKPENSSTSSSEENYNREWPSLEESNRKRRRHRDHDKVVPPKKAQKTKNLSLENPERATREIEEDDPAIIAREKGQTNTTRKPEREVQYIRQGNRKLRTGQRPDITRDLVVRQVRFWDKHQIKQREQEWLDILEKDIEYERNRRDRSPSPENGKVSPAWKTQPKEARKNKNNAKNTLRILIEENTWISPYPAFKKAELDSAVRLITEIVPDEWSEDHIRENIVRTARINKEGKNGFTKGNPGVPPRPMEIVFYEDTMPKKISWTYNQCFQERIKNKKPTDDYIMRDVWIPRNPQSRRLREKATQFCEYWNSKIPETETWRYYTVGTVNGFPGPYGRFDQNSPYYKSVDQIAADVKKEKIDRYLERKRRNDQLRARHVIQDDNHTEHQGSTQTFEQFMEKATTSNANVVHEEIFTIESGDSGNEREPRPRCGPETGAVGKNNTIMKNQLKKPAPHTSTATNDSGWHTVDESNTFRRNEEDRKKRKEAREERQKYERNRDRERKRVKKLEDRGTGNRDNFMKRKTSQVKPQKGSQKRSQTDEEISSFEEFLKSDDQVTSEVVIPPHSSLATNQTNTAEIKSIVVVPPGPNNENINQENEKVVEESAEKRVEEQDGDDDLADENYRKSLDGLPEALQD